MRSVFLSPWTSRILNFICVSLHSRRYILLLLEVKILNNFH
nr:MAG TPA: hypothetical protein [Caudoviricetes sp.]